MHKKKEKEIEKIKLNTTERNHNFDNKFCICKDFYNEKEFMISCMVCLDFFHDHHLNLTEKEVIIFII